MDIDEVPWDENTSMTHPRNPEANEISCWTNNPDTQIVPANPLCVEMNAIELQPAWRSWMMHWVYWDVDDQTYVGYCPDNDEICRDKDPTIFLLLFGEASIEWTASQ